MNDSQAKTTARWIRPLPERLVNKIAAGEVIERPAAVVKELVENSFDAGADRIEIIIEKSGSKLIKIVDNGCGISEEQIEVAFARHATSKIYNFDDLEKLASYGFRGEALPSIASVSRLRMISRTPEADIGTEVIYEGGVLHEKRPASGPVGTTVEVENLFFNTPARRKFLKSEATEVRHISRLVTALAMSHPKVAFGYTLNGRNIFSLPDNQAPGERIEALLSPGAKLIEVNAEENNIKLTGYVGKPDLIQSNRLSQYLFINDRFIYSASFSHAFAAGYTEMMPRGMFPVGALMIQVDPAEIDVNVHPSKTEVKLSHERDVYSLIFKGIKHALRQEGIVPVLKTSPDISAPGHEHTLPFKNEAAPRNTSSIPGIMSPKKFDPGFIRELYRAPSTAGSESSEIIKVDKNTGEIIESESPTHADTPSPTNTGQPLDQKQTDTTNEIHPDEIILLGKFSDLYLLFQVRDQLYILDQHAAHERVLYETTYRQIQNRAVVAQQLLFPVQVELSPVQLAVFEEAQTLMNESGFTVSPFGGRMINIEAVPSILSKKSPEKSIFKILDDLESLKKAGHDSRKAMAQSMACRAAVMAGDKLNEREAVGLLASLFKCENAYVCPHGRPTYIKVSRSDLDRQFGRE